MSKILPPNAGKGRVKGVPNKLTSSVRDAFKHVFMLLQQGDTPETRKASLDEWAKRNPAAFYQLAARLIPAEVNLSVTGKLAERLRDARQITGKSAPPSDGDDDGALA